MSRAKTAEKSSVDAVMSLFKTLTEAQQDELIAKIFGYRSGIEEPSKILIKCTGERKQ